MNPDWINIAAAFLSTSTPLFLVVLGLMMQEKVGVLNIGVVGLITLGALTAFTTTSDTNSYLLGYTTAALLTAIISAGFAFFVVVMMVNPYLAGFGLWVLGIGLSALLSAPYLTQTLPPMPFANESPIWQDPMVFISLLLILTAHFVFQHTRMGLIMRAIGHSAKAAHILGHEVLVTRFIVTIIGGLLCGLGGAHLALTHPLGGAPSWQEISSNTTIWLTLGLSFVAGWRFLRIVPAVLCTNLLILGVPIFFTPWFSIDLGLWVKVGPLIVLFVILCATGLAHKWPDRPKDLGRGKI